MAAKEQNEFEATTGSLIRRKTATASNAPMQTLSKDDAMTMDRSTTPYRE